MSKKIFVTKPHLPPLEDVIPFLEKIWESSVLTNKGPFHQQFENELCKFLGVKYISLFSNGTLALMTALHALNISGEVITTPYSFVATTHSLWWNNIKPVFVDIEAEYGNIDPDKIEKAITSATTAILPVHVYGNPCFHNKIGRIARKHKLKVIYDAAHAFGVKENNKTILNYGDLSVLSFHATKVFNTFEGGAIVSHSQAMKNHIDNLKNFGFRNEVTVVTPGINAKMNEFQSAIGILQLKQFNNAVSLRKKIFDLYFESLKNVNGIRIIKPSVKVEYNYSYMPLLIDKEKFGRSRNDVYNDLIRSNIYGRRYFYPLISEFPIYRSLSSSGKKLLPVAYKTSQQIICLPIYPDLSEGDAERIINILLKK